MKDQPPTPPPSSDSTRLVDESMPSIDDESPPIDDDPMPPNDRTLPPDDSPPPPYDSSLNSDDIPPDDIPLLLPLVNDSPSTPLAAINRKRVTLPARSSLPKQNVTSSPNNQLSSTTAAKAVSRQVFAWYAVGSRRQQRPAPGKISLVG